MFQALDSRVRLLWWLSFSLLAMFYSTVEPIVVLIFVLYLAWQAAGMTKKLVRFTLGLLPFLVVISILSFFPTFDIERAIRMCMRYYILLGATTLIIATTSYSELTNALRNLGHPRLNFLNKPLEAVSLTLGLAFLTVPIAAEEWESLKEIQRARGMDLDRGKKLQQVRRGITLVQPLLLRILERIKYFSIAFIVYDYNPFQERTLYQPLTLSLIDKAVAFAIIAATAVGVALAFIFKV